MPFGRLLTVRYFSAKIVEIERFALRAAILHECQNYLKDGGGLVFLAPPSQAIIPDAHPLGTFETQDGRHYTEKSNGFPFLDILGYLKNTHKNPKFGRVR